MRRFLSRKNFDVFLTARDYDAITGLAETLGIDIEIFGRYGEDLYEKLIYEGERISTAARKLSEYRERILAGVAYPNPVEARVIYGVGKKLVVLSDSPHAVHPHRLTLSLASYLVFSDCISLNSWSEYTHARLKLRPYKGFDELSWFEEMPEVFSKRHIEVLGLRELEYIVIRPEEFRASYYTWSPKAEFWKNICERILSKRLRVVILPRYRDQREYFERVFRDSILRGEVIVPEPRRAVGPALVRYSIATITGGGTIAREAALQGVPGVITFPITLEVDKCVTELNLPLKYISEINRLDEFINAVARDPEKMRVDTRDTLRERRSPLETIYEILREIALESK